MEEERGLRPESAQQRPGASPGADDPGDAVPPGVAAGPPAGDEGSGRRGAERDPGGAVPPGVAPLEPPEPTEEDLRVLEKLRDLPRRG
ncbi:MAG: hypothetical protein ICV73_15625 [Acetobacteraceae bacterium]|nr:hypothetical protein [Acetobacteraceae bacterium]